MTLQGRVHPLMGDCFRAAHLQGLLCGGEIGRVSVMCRPTAGIHQAEGIAAEQSTEGVGAKRFCF